MAKGDFHVVGKQIFDLVFNQVENAYIIENEISMLVRENLLPAMEEVFDELLPKGQLIQLDRLELEIGTLDESTLRERLVEEVIGALRSELKMVLLSQFKLEQKELNIAVLDHWFHFLKTGSRSWNSAELEVDKLEQVVLHVMSKNKIKRATLRALLVRNKIGLRRMILQQRPLFLDQLATLFTDQKVVGLKSRWEKLKKIVIKLSGKKERLRQTVFFKQFFSSDYFWMYAFEKILKEGFEGDAPKLIWSYLEHVFGGKVLLRLMVMSEKSGMDRRRRLRIIERIARELKVEIAEREWSDLEEYRAKGNAAVIGEKGELGKVEPKNIGQDVDKSNPIEPMKKEGEEEMGKEVDLGGIGMEKGKGITEKKRLKNVEEKAVFEKKHKPAPINLDKQKSGIKRESTQGENKDASVKGEKILSGSLGKQMGESKGKKPVNLMSDETEGQRKIIANEDASDAMKSQKRVSVNEETGLSEDLDLTKTLAGEIVDKERMNETLEREAQEGSLLKGVQNKEGMPEGKTIGFQKDKKAHHVGSKRVESREELSLSDITSAEEEKEEPLSEPIKDRSEGEKEKGKNEKEQVIAGEQQIKSGKHEQVQGQEPKAMKQIGETNIPKIEEGGRSYGNELEKGEKGSKEDESNPGTEQVYSPEPRDVMGSLAVNVSELEDGDFSHGNEFKKRMKESKTRDGQTESKQPESVKDEENKTIGNNSESVLGKGEKTREKGPEGEEVKAPFKNEEWETTQVKSALEETAEKKDSNEDALSEISKGDKENAMEKKESDSVGNIIPTMKSSNKRKAELDKENQLVRAESRDDANDDKDHGVREEKRIHQQEEIEGPNRQQQANDRVGDGKVEGGRRHPAREPDWMEEARKRYQDWWESLYGKKEGEEKDVAIGSNWYVALAGVVLLHPFLPTFFKEFDLLDGRKFKDETARHRAIHLLQYVVTGKEGQPEHLLLLLKFICGLPFEIPIEREVTLTTAEKEESEKLLKAVINNWGAMGNSSINAFREGFLQRDGKLEMRETGWYLIVEQKTIDILFQRLPWNISLIRLPWLEDLLKVEWA